MKKKELFNKFYEKNIECKQDVLARTIYGEARGEYTRLEGGLSSLIAVGNVVMNRVQAATWFGDDIISVCHKPHQFACWGAHDPNRHVIQSVARDNPLFQLCFDIAGNLCAGTYPDLTQGSTHYHHQSIRPLWACQAKPRAHIGRHIFYRVS